MKSERLKTLLSLAAVLAASAHSMTAQAHCLSQSITQTGTTNALQQDVYMLLCPTGTASITGKTSLITGGAVTYQIAKGGYTSAAVTDSTASASSACGVTTINGVPTDIILSGSTAQISVAGGAGAYSMMLSKNSTTASNYLLEFHCLDSAGVIISAATGGVWEQGGPASNSGIGLTDALDAVSGSSLLANDINTDINLIINH